MSIEPSKFDSCFVVALSIFREVRLYDVNCLRRQGAHCSYRVHKAGQTHQCKYSSLSHEMLSVWLSTYGRLKILRPRFYSCRPWFHWGNHVPNSAHFGRGMIRRSFGRSCESIWSRSTFLNLPSLMGTIWPIASQCKQSMTPRHAHLWPFDVSGSLVSILEIWRNHRPGTLKSIQIRWMFIKCS